MIVPVYKFIKFIDVGNKYLRGFFQSLDAGYLEAPESVKGSQTEPQTQEKIFVQSLDELKTLVWGEWNWSTCEESAQEVLGSYHFASFILLQVNPGGCTHIFGYTQEMSQDGMMVLPTRSTHGQWDHQLYITGDMRHDSQAFCNEASVAVVRKAERLAGFKFISEPRKSYTTGVFLDNADLYAGHRQSRNLTAVKTWGMPNYFTQVGNTVVLIYTSSPRVYEEDERSRHNFGDVELTILSTVEEDLIAVTREGDNDGMFVFGTEADYIVVRSDSDCFEAHSVHFNESEFKPV